MATVTDEKMSSIPSNVYAYVLSEEGGFLTVVMWIGTTTLKIFLLAAGGIFGLTRLFRRPAKSAKA